MSEVCKHCGSNVEGDTGFENGVGELMCDNCFDNLGFELRTSALEYASEGDYADSLALDYPSRSSTTTAISRSVFD